MVRYIVGCVLGALVGAGIGFFARCIRAKITDILISEMGKEKPRKKVSSLSFSMFSQCPYSLFKMTGIESVSASERQSREAW